MKVFISTLGCKVNQYESEVMLEMLLSSGFKKAIGYEDADVIIVNSCTVTSTGDQKVRQLLHKARRLSPSATIILTGCMPQAFPDVAERFDDADIILGNSNRKELLPSVMSFMSNGQRIVNIKRYSNNDKFEKMSVTSFDERTRAFVKIEDGCNRFCSYCIIPYARGRVRSKPLDELKQELYELSQNGYKEVVLVGINLSAYGQDIGLHLCDAIETACSIDGIDRVRLGSLEPEQMDIDVIKRLSVQDKLCPQFHLSLQSGCDKTLKNMNRHYTSSQYETIVNNLKENFKNPSFTTDIMVGFAGETDEDFEQSLSFAKKIGFAKVHVFSYSRREGTKAYNYSNQLTNAVKSRRNKIMQEVTQESRKHFLNSQVGLNEQVLFESKTHDGYYEGYTKNYTPIRVKSEDNISGKILNVKVIEARDEFCIGELIID